MARAFHVDTKWLGKEATIIGNGAAPRCPLVVGGSGLLGCNLVVFLAHVPGCEKIKVLDMRPPRAEVEEAVREAGLEMEFIEHCLGSDNDDEVLQTAVDGSDCVFSTVTPHVQYASERDFYVTNDEGVKRLLAACQAKRVPRFVHLSSIAVTNHFVDSLNQCESDPLPPFESYESPYDISKLRGEQAVLAANGQDGMVTCSIRVGGIMLSPWDFVFANLWPLIPGMIVVPCGKNIDFIDGRDVCRSLLMAAQALQDRATDTAGEVFFVTKGSSRAPGEVARCGAKHLGYPFIFVPDWVIAIAYYFVMLFHIIRKFCGCQVPGIPPHRFMQMLFHEKTFDNSKAREILGFVPKIGLDEAVSRIVSLRLQECGETFSRPRNIMFSHSAIFVVILSVLSYVLRAASAF